MPMGQEALRDQDWIAHKSDDPKLAKRARHSHTGVDRLPRTIAGRAAGV